VWGRKIFQTPNKMGSIYIHWATNQNFKKQLKNSSLKITYKSDNKKERLLSVKNGSVTAKFNKSSIYQLTCPDCNI